MEKKIFLGGLGGQGVVLAGKLLGMAAVKAKQFATSYSEYAPAMRNGYTYTTLIVSDKEVGAPVTESYDCMVFFDEDSCVTQNACLKMGGDYIVNTSLVTTMPDKARGRIFRVPASEIADELGNERLLNVIMLGAIAAVTHAVETQYLEEIIQSMFGKKPEIAKLNITALHRGMEEIEKQLQAEKGGAR